MIATTLEQKLAALEKEPDQWVRENARGVLLGEQCRRCLATLIAGKPAPRAVVLCRRCTDDLADAAKQDQTQPKEPA